MASAPAWTVASVVLALCTAAAVCDAATVTRLVGATTCDAAPLATLNLTADAHTVELTGFAAGAHTLYFALYIADVPTRAEAAAVAGANFTLTARSYGGDRVDVAVLPACPEDAATPAPSIAADTFLALGAPLAVPLWRAGSLVVRATLLPSRTHGVSSATVLAATLAPATPDPAVSAPGSTCAVPRTLALTSPAGFTVLGDTAASARVPSDCSEPSSSAASLTVQHQWYLFHVPNSSSSDDSSSGSESGAKQDSSATTTETKNVLLQATVQPFQSLWAPRVDVFAVEDCDGASNCTVPASSSVIIQGARTPEAVAWRAVPGTAYLLRVAADADAGVLAAGRFVLRVADVSAGGDAEEGHRCSSAHEARLVCGSGVPAVLASAVGTEGVVHTGGTCAGDEGRAGHWFRLVCAESDGRTVAARMTGAVAGAVSGAHISIYAACAEGEGGDPAARGLGCVAVEEGIDADGTTRSAHWHVPRGTHAFLVFVRGVATNYTLSFADATQPSPGTLVVSPIPESEDFPSSESGSSESSASLSHKSSSSPLPSLSSSSSSHAHGRGRSSLDRAVTVAVLVVAVLFVGAAAGMALCWLRALRRRRRDASAAAALEMTSAFGDVLDTMDDDDDEDDFTFSDPHGSTTTGIDAAVPDPLAVPQTPNTVFTIDDGDE